MNSLPLNLGLLEGFLLGPMARKASNTDILALEEPSGCCSNRKTAGKIYHILYLFST